MVRMRGGDHLTQRGPTNRTVIAGRRQDFYGLFGANLLDLLSIEGGGTTRRTQEEFFEGEPQDRLSRNRAYEGACPSLNDEDGSYKRRDVRGGGARALLYLGVTLSSCTETWGRPIG